MKNKMKFLFAVCVGFLIIFVSINLFQFKNQEGLPNGYTEEEIMQAREKYGFGKTESVIDKVKGFIQDLKHGDFGTSVNFQIAGIALLVLLILSVFLFWVIKRKKHHE